MTAKERFKDKLISPDRSAGQIRMSAAAVALAADCAIHFLLSAVLSAALLSEDCAPFGVAFVGAAGPGLCGGSALLGACFGYLTTLPFSQGLRHASAAILTFAVAFAFCDLRPFRLPWVMPVTAGAIQAFTGAIVLSRTVWTMADSARFILEVLLTALALFTYRAALGALTVPKQDRLSTTGQRAGLLFLLATALMALSPLSVGWDISAGRTLSVLAILCAGWQGGPAPAAIAGAALGTAMDVAAGGTPLYTMVFACAALAAGLCRGKKRLSCAMAYVLTNALTVLGLWSQQPPISLLYEVFLASILFLLLPQRPLRRLGVWLAPDVTGPADLRAQAAVRQKLEASAKAFRTLEESLRAAFRAPQNDNDVASVFDRAAGRVCRSCTLRNSCWNTEYTTTFNALNDATAPMVDRGKAEAGDFPSHFTSRCLHFPAFLGAVNEELTALFYRRQYNARLRENRAAVCRQYAQLSDLLDFAAAELSRELTPDLTCDRRLRQRVAELGLEVRTAAFRDSRGLLRIEAEGPGCAALARPSRLAELSSLLGAPLRLEQEGENVLSLLQQEPLMAVAGVAARKRSGETVSGDAGTYFKRADGKLYVLLCDGMGSGPEANRESSLAVRLLEQFLQAGVEVGQALNTLSSALALRGEETGGFTTVDLLQVDLFTGEGELLKLGAAPTYLKKGDTIQKLAGSSLPAGLGEGTAIPTDRFTLRLSPGDTVLMVSDGICGTGTDGWLREKLAAFDGASPKDLARELITERPQDATDDRTALVIRIEKRT